MLLHALKMDPQFMDPSTESVFAISEAPPLEIPPATTEGSKTLKRAAINPDVLDTTPEA